VILFARHGETADNVPPERMMGWRDPPLDARGREQAQALARQVAGKGLKAIWTSHLRRARETAAAVGAVAGLTPRADERLAESRRGSWEGRLVEEIERSEPEAWSAWQRGGADFRFPGGGESLGEHQQRVLAALDDVRAGPLPALVVCHGGTIRCVAAHHDPRGLEAYQELAVPNATVLRLA
jgi:2,3-bisphosphoglycerate-dependent phosphoglycerate mutase